MALVWACYDVAGKLLHVHESASNDQSIIKTCETAGEADHCEEIPSDNLLAKLNTFVSNGQLERASADRIYDQFQNREPSA